WEGEEISNRQALLILDSVYGVYYDVNEEKFVVRYGIRESRIVPQEEVWKRVVDGIKKAVANLHYHRERTAMTTLYELIINWSALNSLPPREPLEALKSIEADINS